MKAELLPVTGPPHAGDSLYPLPEVGCAWPAVSKAHCPAVEKLRFHTLRLQL